MSLIIDKTTVLKVLLLDDKQNEIDELKTILYKIRILHGILIESISFISPIVALDYLATNSVDAIITDKDLQNPIDGVSFLKKYHDLKKKHIPTILYTAGVLNDKEDAYCKKNEILFTQKSTTQDEFFLLNFLQNIPNYNNTSLRVAKINNPYADIEHLKDEIIEELKSDLIAKLKNDGNLDQKINIGLMSGQNKNEITIAELITDIQSNGIIGLRFLKSFNTLKIKHKKILEDGSKKITFWNYVKKNLPFFF